MFRIKRITNKINKVIVKIRGEMKYEMRNVFFQLKVDNIKRKLDQIENNRKASVYYEVALKLYYEANRALREDKDKQGGVLYNAYTLSATRLVDEAQRIGK